MTRVDVRVDSSELVRALARKPEAMRRVAARFLPLVGQLGRDRMVQTTQRKFKRPTGVLSGSIRAVVAGTKVTIGPNVPYQHWVNNGRGEVVPKNAKALSFVIGGRRIFAKRVRAFPGHHFVEATAAQIGPESRELLIALIRQEVSRG